MYCNHVSIVVLLAEPSPLTPILRLGFLIHRVRPQGLETPSRPAPGKEARTTPHHTTATHEKVTAIAMHSPATYLRRRGAGHVARGVIKLRGVRFRVHIRPTPALRQSGGRPRTEG